MCGIAGVWFPSSVDQAGHVHPVEILAIIAAGNQHRGHTATGAIVARHKDRSNFVERKDWGLVFDVLDDAFRKEQCHCGIVHTLYQVTGARVTGNIQPFYNTLGDADGREQIAVAHNGNLVSELLGARPSDSDTWCVLEAFSKATKSQPLYRRIWYALEKLSGSYSLVFLHQDTQGKNSLICARDPYGVRPLYLARFGFSVRGTEQYGYIASSETRSFDSLGIYDYREIKRGEIVTINKDGCCSFRSQAKGWADCPRKSCIFEPPYFMGANSRVDTKGSPIEALDVREALGRQAAKEFREKYPEITAEALSCIPDSSRSQGYGAATELDVPTPEFIFRSHTVGRTFISEVDSIVLSVSRKFYFSVQRIRQLREIFLIDDSIVRSNTLKNMIARIRRINPNIKIHVIICFPPVICPCFLGIAMSTVEELAWYKYGQSVEGVCKGIGADTLYYISLEGFLGVIKALTGYAPEEWCTACITGIQPITIERRDYQREMEKLAQLRVPAASKV